MDRFGVSNSARQPVVLTVPGLNNSGPDHWQSVWEETRPFVRSMARWCWRRIVWAASRSAGGAPCRAKPMAGRWSGPCWSRHPIASGWKHPIRLAASAQHHIRRCPSPPSWWRAAMIPIFSSSAPIALANIGAANSLMQAIAVISTRSLASAIGSSGRICSTGWSTMPVIVPCQPVGCCQPPTIFDRLPTASSMPIAKRKDEKLRLSACYF